MANEFKCKEIETEHLLLATLKEESSLLVPILQRYNVTYDRCYYQLRKLQ
ncbi:MAG: Clp protease N-terminal domain-containing protein [bacterium]